jgi:hypothetical protein
LQEWEMRILLGKPLHVSEVSFGIAFIGIAGI